MQVIAGSASRVLAFRVARLLGVELCEVEYKRFPDGERYLRVLGDVEGKDFAVVQSMHHTPDLHLFDYLLLADTLKDLGAKKVYGIIPYFPYARQDKRFNPGEALSPKTVARLIESVGTDYVMTVDIHAHRIGGLSKLFRIPALNVTAAPILARFVKENYSLKDLVVIGADEEAGPLAQSAAELLSAEHDVLVKGRISPEEVEIRPKALNVKGRDVLIIDDIVSTGGTVVEALKVLRGQGAKRVVVACTHPIIVGDALAKIYEAGAEAVVGTDSILSPVSVVSVAPLIAEALSKAR